MLDVTASYGVLFDFIVFLGILTHYIIDDNLFELLYLHQTFTDCVSN